MIIGVVVVITLGGVTSAGTLRGGTLTGTLVGAMVVTFLGTNIVWFSHVARC